MLEHDLFVGDERGVQRVCAALVQGVVLAVVVPLSTPDAPAQGVVDSLQGLLRDLGGAGLRAAPRRLF